MYENFPSQYVIFLTDWLCYMWVLSWGLSHAADTSRWAADAIRWALHSRGGPCFGSLPFSRAFWRADRIFRRSLEDTIPRYRGHVQSIYHTKFRRCSYPSKSRYMGLRKRRRNVDHLHRRHHRMRTYPFHFLPDRKKTKSLASDFLGFIAAFIPKFDSFPIQSNFSWNTIIEAWALFWMQSFLFSAFVLHFCSVYM